MNSISFSIQFSSSHLRFYCLAENSHTLEYKDSVASKLKQKQNATTILVSYTPLFSPITPVLVYLHWLPVRYRIVFKIPILTFDAFHGIEKKYQGIYVGLVMSSYLHYCPPPPLRTSKLYPILSVILFTYATLKEWNFLPVDIISILSFLLVKIHLKAHLYRKALTTHN